MHDNLKKLLQKEMTRKNFLHLIAIGIISILGFGGVISFLLAHASTPDISAEAEGGTLAGGATIGSDTNASGDEYVKFGTAPSGGSGSPTPMMSEYSSYVLADGGDFEFAQMATSTGVLPGSEWELSPSDQIGTPSLLSNVAIENGTGLIINMSNIDTQASACIDTDPTTVPGGGFGCKAPYYREIECTIPNNGSEVYNHFSSWTLTTRAGDDASICGEIDVTEGGWDTNTGTVHTGTTSQSYTYGPDMGVPIGSHKYGVYVTSTEVTWYMDGELITNPGSGRDNPAAFPTAIPADAVWYPLHTNEGASNNAGTDGVNGEIGPSATGTAGQYVVAYDRWFVAP